MSSTLAQIKISYHETRNQAAARQPALCRHRLDTPPASAVAPCLTWPKPSEIRGSLAGFVRISRCRDTTIRLVSPFRPPCLGHTHRPLADRLLGLFLIRRVVIVASRDTQKRREISQSVAITNNFSSFFPANSIASGTSTAPRHYHAISSKALPL